MYPISQPERPSSSWWPDKGKGSPGFSLRIFTLWPQLTASLFCATTTHWAACISLITTGCSKHLFPFPTGHNPEEAKPSGFSESAPIRPGKNKMKGGQLLWGYLGCLKPVKLGAARRCVPLLQAFCLGGSEWEPGGDIEEMKNRLKNNRSDFFLCIYKGKFLKVRFVWRWVIPNIWWIWFRWPSLTV